MRKSLDGKEDVYVQEVPVSNVASKVIVIRGDGVAPKVCISAPDCPDSVMLDIANRFLPNAPYSKVEHVCMGPVALADKHLQKHDQIAQKGGTVFHMGLRKTNDDKPGTVTTTTDPNILTCPMSAWLLTETNGKKCLFVMPHEYDSKDTAEWLSEDMHGEFSIQCITAGSMTADEEIAVQGWTTFMKPKD